MIWVCVNAFRYMNSSIHYTDIIQVKKAKGHIITPWRHRKEKEI